MEVTSLFYFNFKLLSMCKPDYKITFCITCMNRLHQLKETLLKNIQDNIEYQKLEFVVLDYNSQDEIENWARSYLQEYIDNGKLNYYKTKEPKYFNHSHAKNLAFKLANGEILCNLNADHFTGKGYADYVNKAFHKDPNIVITPVPHNFYKTSKRDLPGDLWGKVCVKRDDFSKVKGFDERMIKFGNDDIDFINRLEMINVKRKMIANPIFCKFIGHSQEERFSSRYILNDISAIYINHFAPSISKCIFLYKDHHFEIGTLTDNTTVDSNNPMNAFYNAKANYKYSFKGIYKLGEWCEKMDENAITLSYSGNNSFRLKMRYNNRYDIVLNELDQSIYYAVTKKEVEEELLILNFVLYNAELMQENLAISRVEGNEKGYGVANINKNFQSEMIRVL